MKIRFTYILLLLCSVLTAQIPNASFENWQAVPGALGAEDPVGWTSNNIICDTVNGYPIRKSTIARTGNYALEIRPNCSKFGFRRAQIHLGIATIDSSSSTSLGLNTSCASDTIETPPFILAGYYQYAHPNSNGRDALGQIVLNPEKCRTYFMPWASGSVALTRNTPFSLLGKHSYQAFAIPINLQFDTITDLHYMEIEFSISHNDTSGIDNRVLLIDDLSLHGNLLSVPQENLASMFQVYPNPVKDFVKLKKPEFMEVTEVRIYSASGRKMFAANAWRDRFDLTDFDEGLYIISFHTNAGLITKRLVKL